MNKLKTHKSNLLTIEIEEKENAIQMSWIGMSADRTPGVFLNPIIKDIIDISETRNKEIIMDFKKLEFMNSSTVAPIVKVLDRVKRNSHKFTIRYCKNTNWQELSFSALMVFQTTDERIKILGI